MGLGSSSKNMMDVVKQSTTFQIIPGKIEEGHSILLRGNLILNQSKNYNLYAIEAVTGVDLVRNWLVLSKGFNILKPW